MQYIIATLQISLYQQFVELQRLKKGDILNALVFINMYVCIADINYLNKLN